MRDAALIADLVRAGLAAELVGRVVNEITASMSGTNVRDNIRTYETLRKRNQRKISGKQTMSAAIDPENVPDNVPDKAKDRRSLVRDSLNLQGEVAAEKESKRVVASRRGTSLTTDWRMSLADRAVAIELEMTPREIDEFEVEFRDYWIAIPGSRGRKCDWPATVRNRLREVAKRRRKPNGHGSPTMAACDDLIARAEGSGGAGDPPMRDITPRGGAGH